MPLRERINEQFNTALKSKNKSLISTLRLVLAAIKDKDIANRTSEKKELAKDEEIIKILRKMKKQRQDSSDMYKKGGRQELLEAEQEEEETKKICKEQIDLLGANNIKDMGKIMGSLKKKYSDSIDFSRVNLIIKDLLNK